MSRTEKHRNLLRERLTIFLVLFFCFLISSSEYVIQGAKVETNTEQGSSQDEKSTGSDTYVNAAVDAVVPFIFASVDHAFHLIDDLGEYFELVSSGPVEISYTSIFSEILLEKIISTNAP